MNENVNLSSSNLPQQIVSDKDIISYLDLFQGTSGFSDIEKNQFIQISKMSNLNPFKREIYISAYGDGQYRKCSIIVGYEVYIKRAELSGLLDGWSTSISACSSIKVNKDTSAITTVKDFKATIEIRRKDFSTPFVHEVVFSEYVQKTKQNKINKFWSEKPQTMLKKVAISQGFRLCFSEILGGLPYTKEEILDEAQTININAVDSVSDNDTILGEAMSDLLDATTIDLLSRLWDTYPQLQNSKKWIDSVNLAKSELLKSEKDEEKAV